MISFRSQSPGSLHTPTLIGSTLSAFPPLPSAGRPVAWPPASGRVKLHLINAWHAGDVLLTRPMIRALQPHFDLSLECTPRCAYLWADLGLPIAPGWPDNPSHDSPFRPRDALGVNLWFGTYDDILQAHGMTVVTQALTFNRRMAESGLNWNFQVPNEPAPVDFPPPARAVAVLPDSILVENGPAQSGQCRLELSPLLPQLFAEFPHVNFYCAAPPPVQAPNVFDVSHLNLIELSHVGDQCTALITRGSGVSAACYTRASMWKPRAIVGWNWRIIVWHNQVEWIYDYEKLRDFTARAIPVRAA